MEEFDFYYIARKSVRGFVALVSRTFFIQLLTTITGFILAAYLAPSDYGIFVVVSSIVVFLSYFQDIGLAASLIQKKEAPTIAELRSTFTVQQILVLAFALPALIFSGSISEFYKLSQQGHLLFVSLIISFFISSLRTIPTVLLERNLNFNKLVIPQIIDTIVYNLCLLYFAISGFGVTSFTIAVLARSITGLVATYIVQPWSIGIAFEKAGLKKLLAFGIPFQAHSLLALIKDDLLNVYIGRILPFSQVGYIGFAQKMAYTPLRLIMDNIIRITFPSFSRIQHDREALKIAIDKSLFLISLVIFPLIVILIFFSPYLISFIPAYNQWLPSVLSISLFASSSIFSSIITPLTNFLNAVGKVRTTLYFMTGWTASTWILTPFFIYLFGFNGVALANLLISISSLGVVLIVKKHISFSFVKSVGMQFIAAFGMACFIILTQSFIHSIASLLAVVSLSAVVYVVFIFLLAKNELLSTVGFIIKSIRS